MCMGLGCNAAGVVATRIIDSPRERLIAIITNNFSLCNGRWPTQILVAIDLLGGACRPWAGLISALAVVGVAVLGVGFISRPRGCCRARCCAARRRLQPRAAALSPAADSATLYTSLIDRTLFVLWRAVVFARRRVPSSGSFRTSPRRHQPGRAVHQWLPPFGLLLGLSGVILLAYVVAIPANEIVVPTVLMLTVLATGVSVSAPAPA